MAVRVAVFVAILLTGWGGTPVHAQALHGFCAAAAKSVGVDQRLSEAVTAVFGAVAFTATSDACIFPLQVLRYPSADVLLTQGNVPGEACHGCAAHLSAYVMQRTGGGLKVVRRLMDFAALGSQGAIGDIRALSIGGDDGFVAASGGTFQGYTVTDLDVYVFRGGRVVHLDASPSITLDADNGGAMTDDSKAVSVTGSWSIDPARTTDIVVDYKVQAGGRARVDRVVWTLQGSRLVLTKGRVPPEVETASGKG